MLNGHTDSLLLRRALLGNACFSTLSGIAFLVASKPLAEFIGLAQPAVLIPVGLSLLVFAAGLLQNARRDTVNRTEATIAVVLDFAWVVGTGVVVLAGVLNTAGNWTAAIIADVVLVFAVLQALGLRRQRQTGMA
jgi:hypothetical protein